MKQYCVTQRVMWKTSFFLCYFLFVQAVILLIRQWSHETFKFLLRRVPTAGKRNVITIPQGVLREDSFGKYWCHHQCTHQRELRSRFEWVEPEESNFNPLDFTNKKGSEHDERKYCHLRLNEWLINTSAILPFWTEDWHLDSPRMVKYNWLALIGDYWTSTPASRSVSWPRRHIVQ